MLMGETADYIGFAASARIRMRRKSWISALCLPRSFGEAGSLADTCNLQKPVA